MGEKKAIEAVWYTGRMMGETLAQTICKKKWLTIPEIGLILQNFSILSIKHMTGYGPSQKNEDRFHWEHKDGIVCIHLNYDKNRKKFVAINSFGI